MVGKIDGVLNRAGAVVYAITDTGAKLGAGNSIEAQFVEVIKGQISSGLMELTSLPD